MSGARRVPSLANLLVLAIASVVSQTTARAHVLDEYVQSTLVDIDADSITLRINLTPGVEVAEQVIALIDADGDGEIAHAEAEAYALRVKQDLAAKLDGREVELQFRTASVPAASELQSGEGVIQMEFALAGAEFADGAHTVTINNRHLPKMGVYLFNAAAPRSDAIEIVRQTRSKNQSSGEIAFAYHGPVIFAMPMTVRLVALIGVAGLAVVLVVVALALASRRRPNERP